MPSDYAKTLGARLRAIRTQQGLSLHGVEEKSRGRWKAVVVGSYERGDRSVTVQKLAELADFYGVPVSELLPGDAAPGVLTPAPKLVIDLEKMAQLPRDQAGPLARYVATIQSQRGDYNGRVLSIRQEDLRSLAVIYDKTPADLTEELISWGILDSAARGAVDSG
jgi:transcriptional regulator with XRE-family HTH domain